MADQHSRPYRNRDPLAADDDAFAQGQDPLAELARLIGQSVAGNDIDRAAPARQEAYDPQPAGTDWAGDPRYADQYADPDPGAGYDGYRQRGHEYDDGRYAPPPREPDLFSSYRPAPSQDIAYAPPAASVYAPPAGRAGAGAAYATEQSHDPDEPELSSDYDRRQTATVPQPGVYVPARDDRYDYDDDDQAGAEDHSYAADEFDEEAPTGRRRRGVAVVATVLGLALLGTAGAFAYRAMFGGSMLPSLPPIIKADTGPNKIVPAANPQAASAGQASANGGEKLVSREETPVNVPAPVNAAPRVVSTIPVFPAPDAAGSGTANPTPVAVPPPAAASPFPPAPVMPGAVSAEPKKIHTVAIRPDQMGSPDAAAAAMAPVPSRTANPPRPAPAAAAAPAPRPAPPPSGANAPLSIVPGSGGAAASAPPARTRTAMAQPTSLSPAASEATAPAAGGGYAVQITSQRSEADAQSAFRSLQAKYPSQLGGHQPLIRRADLGDKGVYYRAMVGPFASAEQAASLCSSLKAVGGNCIVQRN